MKINLSGQRKLVVAVVAASTLAAGLLWRPYDRRVQIDEHVQKPVHDPAQRTEQADDRPDEPDMESLPPSLGAGDAKTSDEDDAPQSWLGSSYPRDPLTEYLKHLDPAKGGSAESAFQLYSILKECSNFIPTTDVDKTLIREGIRAAQIELTGGGRCDALYAYLKATNMSKLATSWLKAAEEAGSPTADLAIGLSGGYPFNPRIIDSFSSALHENPEKAVEYGFYILSSIPTQNYAAGDTWYAANCYLTEICSEEFLTRELSSSYREFELASILADARSISSRLRQGNIEDVADLFEQTYDSMNPAVGG